MALVSESFARAQFASADAVGQRIQLGRAEEWGPWLTIAGVVGNVRQEGLDHAPDQAVYVPQAASPSSYARLLVRTAGEPLRYERAVRQAIRAVDPNQPIFHLQAMEAYVAASPWL